MKAILRLSARRRSTIDVNEGIHTIKFPVMRRADCVCDDPPIDLGQDEPHTFCHESYVLV